MKKKKIIGEEELDFLSPHHPTMPPPPPPLPPNPPSLTLKFLILGSPRSGKTSLIRRYTSRSFSSIYETTVGADYTKRDVSIKYSGGVVSVRCQIWDIAGQDRFAHLTRAYFNKADGVCIVCDVSRQETVMQVKEWKNEVDRCLGGEVPILLFCNKSDLPPTSSQLQTGALIQQVCKESNIPRWFETSAKEGGGVDDGFNYVVRECLKREEVVEFKKRQAQQNRKRRDKINLIKPEEAPANSLWADVCVIA
ncbi:hypothetical protein TrCOL_g8276 [Triparma columacea]|uniref:Uncharacterized protein n=1 Tax=Triparma columacea TaxID=722753 RepID=A0A9W7G6A0_9STRA|nr:hypothetical protein TrCOL_g8276 [Triparma columacea]